MVSSGYAIDDLARLTEVALLLLLIPFLGFGITRIRHPFVRILAWAFTCMAVALTDQLTAAEAAGIRMLAIVVALLWSTKIVVAVESSKDSSARLPLAQWLTFVVCWFGMRPRLFAVRRSEAQSGWTDLICQGVVRMATGALLVVAARQLWNYRSADGGQPVVLATMTLLAGLSLILHFGIFNMLAGVLRWAGYKCTSLFRAPLRSHSLTEFWGRRWNRGFSEMTAVSVFRPLRSWLGDNAATMLAFLFSGLLHELAISLPVRQGYGLPMLYFAIHCIGMFAEGQLERRQVRWLDHWFWGRLWTGSWIFLPLPLLFHQAFLQGCVWPLLEI